MYILKPFFYDRFQCIGKECPYTCCGGWNIGVDKDSYARYEQYEGDIKRKIEENIEYMEEKDIHVMRLNEKGVCLFCDEEQLCMLIKEKGEEALCLTCKRYPREQFMTVTTEEQYLSLSCPAVVSFLKDLKEPLSFILEGDGRAVDDGLGEGVPEETRKEIEELYSTIELDLWIRDQILDFLQNREQPLWFREFFAAYCWNRIEEARQQGKKEEVQALLEEMLNPAFMERIMEALGNIRKEEEKQFYQLRSMMVEFQEKIISVTYYDKGNSLLRISKLFHKNVSITYEEYKECMEEWAVGEEENFNILMEQVIAYEWMRYAMEGWTSSYMVDNYWEIVCEQILIKYLCIMHYAVYREIHWEDYEIIIAFVIRGLSHGREMLKTILEDLKEQNILSVANLYWLVQS